MGIGQRIRAEREAQKISRVELAKAAGMASSTLSDLELGYSTSTTALHRIAAYLGVRTEWLETGKGPKVTHTGAHGQQSELTGEKFSVREGPQSHYSGPDPAILHEAVTLLLFDLDHGGPRPARSASDLLLDLYQRLVAGGGRLTKTEQWAFEDAARSRGQTGATQHAQRKAASKSRAK